jgi:hypothetical protein
MTLTRRTPSHPPGLARLPGAPMPLIGGSSELGCIEDASPGAGRCTTTDVLKVRFLQTNVITWVRHKKQGNEATRLSNNPACVPGGCPQEGESCVLGRGTCPPKTRHSHHRHSGRGGCTASQDLRTPQQVSDLDHCGQNICPPEVDITDMSHGSWSTP